MEVIAVPHMIEMIRRNESGKNGEGIEKNQNGATEHRDLPVPQFLPENLPGREMNL
jgi:hypothetical protein